MLEANMVKPESRACPKSVLGAHPRKVIWWIYFLLGKVILLINHDPGSDFHHNSEHFNSKTIYLSLHLEKEICVFYSLTVKQFT